jgi:hypothetical protein
MEHGMVGIDTQLSIQRLLVLNPDGGNAATVGTGDVSREAVTDVNGLMSFAVGKFEGPIENRTRRLRLLA